MYGGGDDGSISPQSDSSNSSYADDILIDLEQKCEDEFQRISGSGSAWTSDISMSDDDDEDYEFIRNGGRRRGRKRERRREGIICVLEREGEKAKELREWVKLTCSCFVQWR